MKKIFIALLLLTVSVGVFAQSALITGLSGTVELKAAGSAAYVPAKTGDQISRDTIISTGFRSTALLQAGSAVIAVRPLTRLSLTEISASQNRETLNVNLQAGRVRVDVNPPAGTRAAMTVTSPSATASVRGTSFDFDTQNLAVDQGTVNFRGNRGYEIQVSAGSSSTVATYSGRALPPQNRTNSGIAPQAPVGRDQPPGNSGGTGSQTDPDPTPPASDPDPDPDPTPPPPPPLGPPARPPTTGGVDVGIDYDAPNGGGSATPPGGG